MVSNLKGILLMIFVGFLIYCGGMIIVRFRMTQMAYQFDELKNYERSLREEQVRLQAEVAQKLSPQMWKVKGFAEPKPNQVVVIP